MIYPVPGFPGSFYDTEDDHHFRLTDCDSAGKPLPLPPITRAERAAVDALRAAHGPKKR